MRERFNFEQVIAELRADEAAHPEREAARAAERERERRSALLDLRRYALLESGIATVAGLETRLLEEVARARLAETKATQAVDAWLRQTDAMMLLLLGGTGLGKSTAAAHAIATIVAATDRDPDWSRTAIAVSGTELATLRHRDEQRQRAAALSTANVAVLDDLGAGDSAATAAGLLDFLNRRRGAQEPRTLITSNLTKNELLERYPDPRIVERLQLGAVVSLGGKSLRQKGPGW